MQKSEHKNNKKEEGGREMETIGWSSSQFPEVYVYVHVHVLKLYAPPLVKLLSPFLFHFITWTECGRSRRKEERTG